MSVEDLLNKIEDLLEDGKSGLLGGGKVKVDAEAIRSIISEIRISMPDEVIQARKIAAEPATPRSSRSSRRRSRRESL